MWLSGSKNDFDSSNIYFAKKVSKIYKCIYINIFIVHCLFLFVIRFFTARWTLFILQIFNSMVKRKISLERNFQKLISVGGVLETGEHA